MFHETTEYSFAFHSENLKDLQDIKIEQAVLGLVIGFPDDISRLIELGVTPNTFFDSAHQEIFRVATEIFVAGKKLDMLTVTQELRKKNILEKIGGAAYLARLTYGLGSDLHLEEWVKILIDFSERRETIRIATELSKRARQLGVDICKTKAEMGDALFEQQPHQNNGRSIKEAMVDFVQKKNTEKLT